MLYTFLSICVFIITIGILILIHELGHFTAARICGVTIQRLSIGFGYTLWKYRDKKNTEYIISAVPIGGYVQMLNKHDIKENHTNEINCTFESKTILERMSIILAGPIFNIIFSFLIYWFLFMIGISTYRPIIANIIPNSIVSQNNIPCNVEIQSINKIKTPDWESVRLALIDSINQKEKHILITVNPVHSSQTKRYSLNLINWTYNINTEDIITSLGIIPLPTYIITPIISNIQKNSPGMNAGLKIGDKIVSINNKIVNTWDTFVKEIKNNPNKTVEISIIRKNTTSSLQVTTDTIITNSKSTGFIGISPTYLPLLTKEYIVTHQFGFIESIQKSSEKVWKLISLTWSTLYKLITGDAKLNNLGGPISIAQGAQESLKYGLTSYLIFLSLISINLGVMNLLPVPILDGGRLFFLIFESICGKNISQKIEKYTHHIGIILLILLMCIAIFNDLSKL